jgi:hypothetical protein
MATANFAFPYPVSTNAPDVPVDIKALAEAVDTSLLPVSATATSLANLVGKRVTAAGVIHAAVGGTEVNITKLAATAAIITGSYYRLRARVYVSAPSATSSDDYFVRIRRTTALTGTVVADQPNFIDVPGVDHVLDLDTVWKADVSGSTQFFVSLQRLAGTGTVDVVGDSKTNFAIIGAGQNWADVT